MLDPIDGTKGFLRGGQYAVALALMADGRPQIGLLGCPELDLRGLPPSPNSAPAPSPKSAERRFVSPDLGEGQGGGVSTGCVVYAVRGRGTWMAALEADAYPHTRLHVSRRSKPANARLLRSFEAGHTNVGQIEQFAAALGIQAEPVLMDSQAKYAVLAAGQGDLILRLLSAEQPNYREKAWDQAAGSLVVEEAGGRATDLSGKPFDFTHGRELIDNRGVLVSNGRLHEAALRALRQIRA